MIPEQLDALRVPVEGLSPYGKNPRVGNVDAIVASLEANGQYRPIVVNARTNEVLAGNHTLKAARQLGWSEIAATFVDVDDEQAARIVLVDNRSNDLAHYDDAALVELLESLPDLNGTGFSEGDLEALLASVTELPPALSDPDDVPELPAEPRSKLGDVWVLGPHRVICGDSTDVETVGRVLDGDRADLVWTDPPYGVAYVGKTKDALTIRNDNLDPERLEEFLREAFGAVFSHCQAGACWYVAAPAGPLFLPFAQVLTDLDVWRQTLVWAKDVFVMGRSDYHYRHEAIFYGWVPGAAHHPPDDRKQDTILEFARPKRSKDHPTMKPVDLIAYCIGNSSKHGAVVLDPFGGSGSTLIAAARTGRVARLVELDPVYVDVICRRYQEHTGDKPVLEATGEPHDFTEG